MRIALFWVIFWVAFSIVSWLFLFKYGIRLWNWRKEKYVEFCVREWRRTGRVDTPATRLRLNFDWCMLLIIFVLCVVPSVFARWTLRLYGTVYFNLKIAWVRFLKLLRRLFP